MKNNLSIVIPCKKFESIKDRKFLCQKKIPIIYVVEEVVSYVHLLENEQIFRQDNTFRNVGIENANTEYIFFLDSDDEIKRTEFLELLKQKIDKEVNVYILGNSANIIQNNFKLYNKIYQKSFLKENMIKFNPGIAEDLNFNVKVMEKEPKVKNINYGIIKKNKSNFSKTFSEKILKSLLDNHRETYTILKKKGNSNEIKIFKELIINNYLLRYVIINNHKLCYEDVNWIYKNKWEYHHKLLKRFMIEKIRRRL